MVDILQFDLVFFEWWFVFVQVIEVKIFVVEGDMMVMVGYVVIIIILCLGVLQVVYVNGIEDYIVLGGFVEIGGDSILVLVECVLLIVEVI